MRIVDLRSDTITLPTDAMRKAMASAEVGDDVFGEDPTVNRLEEMSAERTGKEAALFVTSGTMGNLVCQLAQCGRGDEVILGDEAHIFSNEQCGASTLGGISLRTVPNQPDGTLLPEQIERAIRPDNIHCPRTRMIALENTHNRCNGSPLDMAYMDTVGEIARRRNLKLHVDGARIFNAAAAVGASAAELVRHADSVTFCLSKGLGAPVGSMVCGTRDFISEARRIRKVLGGGLRQAGVLAAAGIVALTEMVDRLREDHANARKLADGLAEIEGIGIEPAAIKTNIVFFRIDRPGLTPEEFAKRLREQGVRVGPKPPDHIRAVTNHHISAEDIDYALKACREAVR
ncbi:MAG: low-specificity L-threonine aldolase [Desulfobacteraceae bacterium]|nr:MAG: low-specificity L-threonine aldolase [Desulfobacteraceae bacterium]